MKIELSTYAARIGRNGGRASTPAKRLAARRNACKRWGRPFEPETIAINKLCDATWYCGQGRNSSVGLWDARAKCFWTVAVNDFADALQFPKGFRRQVRLKQENYWSPEGGSFKPFTALKD